MSKRVSSVLGNLSMTIAGSTLLKALEHLSPTHRALIESLDAELIRREDENAALWARIEEYRLANYRAAESARNVLKHLGAPT